MSRDERSNLATLGFVIIAVALGVVAGRIAVVQSKERDTAFLSANDRSRWCTVAALVEDGTYAIDRQINIRDASGKRRPWSTIDRVRHTGPDGVMHDYSSKPPLFSTLVAGVYWAVNKATQMTLTDQPIYVARIVVAIVNLPMFFLLLWCTWLSVIDSLAPASAKLFGITVAAFGTALTPMAISLNNHLPAAAATAVVLCLYLSVAGKTLWSDIATWYFAAGLAAAFAVANELPALAMLVAWFCLFFRQSPIATLAAFLPSVVIVAFAFFITNQLAHQSLRPPYMHRSDGAVLGTISAPGDAVPTADQVTQWLAERSDVPAKKDGFKVLATPAANRWIIESADGNLRFAMTQQGSDAGNGSPTGSTAPWEIRTWDHWYDYPGSYWTSARNGVDRGEPSRLRYMFHVTFGYYGLFSLTPVWLLVPIGLTFRIIDQEGRYRTYLAIAISAVSLICLLFYFSRPLIDRNYGGVSSSFRWMLWFTPLWIWGMMPAVTEAMLEKWAKPIALVLLALSVFSAATALDNPWQHPWIYRYSDFLGWLES